MSIEFCLFYYSCEHIISFLAILCVCCWMYCARDSLLFDMTVCMSFYKRYIFLVVLLRVLLLGVTASFNVSSVQSLILFSWYYFSEVSDVVRLHRSLREDQSWTCVLSDSTRFFIDERLVLFTFISSLTHKLFHVSCSSSCCLASLDSCPGKCFFFFLRPQTIFLVFSLLTLSSLDFVVSVLESLSQFILWFPLVSLSLACLLPFFYTLTLQWWSLCFISHRFSKQRKHSLSWQSTRAVNSKRGLRIAVWNTHHLCRWLHNQFASVNHFQSRVVTLLRQEESRKNCQETISK